MRGFKILLLLAFPCYTFAADCCEIDHDAPPPECERWIDPVYQIPVFFQHQFNCSRYWMCNTDLSDCLCECPPIAGGGALVFDWTIDYENGGPTCNWPWDVDCENKPNHCSRCEAWQDCIECSDCPDCTETCNDGYMCVCRNDRPCQGSNHLACGICKNHVCNEPECCSDDDCKGAKCIDGKCGECQVDADCTGTACSTCSTGSCIDPECCTDTDCLSNEYCTQAHICVVGCNEDSDCPNGSQLQCSECQSNTCTDPECCSDIDCKQDQYCNTDINKCIDGCNEDNDCNSMMTCAKCGADNQCTTPECCANSDCGANHLSCSECRSDNTCTNPECCTNVDCPSDKPICDSQVCMAGCLDDPDCPKYDGICGGDSSYTEEDSSCFYCDGNDNSYGSCEPGCVDNENCTPPQVCTGVHRCKNQGSFVALKTIQIVSSSCVGCSGRNIEGGAVVRLEGKYDTIPDCTTARLDHENQVDYAVAGGSSVFEEKEPLGECYLVNLQSEVHGGDITWKGEGTLTVSKVKTCWSDTSARCSECTVPGPLQKDQTRAMTCIWEK